MTGVLLTAIGALAGLATTALGDMVSEEVRDRLDHLPHAILSLAARRLDAEQRATMYDDEWMPELTYILKGDDARPITRLYHGTRYSIGILVSTHRILGASALLADHFERQIAGGLQILDTAVAQLEYAKAGHAEPSVIRRYERAVVADKAIIDNLSAMKRWAERSP